MSARITALESNQAEFRNQLSEVLMTSQNNEQALKANTLTLDNLATMVTTIMNKLESRSQVSHPIHSGDNLQTIARTPPKSAGENQAQSKPVRAGASSVVPIDVVDVSYVPSSDENPPRATVRMTRSKVGSGAAGNSSPGTRGCRNEKVYRKKRPTRGGANKVGGNDEGSGQPVSARGGTEEGGVSIGGEVEVGGGPDNNTYGGNPVEVIVGNECVEDGSKGAGARGAVGDGDIGEVASMEVGSAEGGKGQVDRGERAVVEAGEIGVVAEETT